MASQIVSHQNDIPQKTTEMVYKSNDQRVVNTG